MNRTVVVCAGLTCAMFSFPLGCSDSSNPGSPASGGSSGSKANGGSSGSKANGGSSGSKANGGSASHQGGAGDSGGDAGDGGADSHSGGAGGNSGGMGGDDSSTGGVGGEGGLDSTLGGQGGDDSALGGAPNGSGGAPDSGGSAGSSSAGSGGTSGSLCGPQVGSASDLLITDLESGTNVLNPPRTGRWFSFGDGTGTMPPPDASFAPEAGGYAASAYYAHFTTTGGTVVGMGFDLNHCDGASHPYDVSAYTGIKFAYKSSHAFYLNVASVATTPPPVGTCAGANNCYNYHFAMLPPSAVWTVVTVPFSTLVQDFGTIAPLDKTKVLNVHVQVRGAWNDQTAMLDQITPASVDIGLDQVEFTTN